MWNDFKAWVKSPFSPQMSVLGWGAFTGLILVLLAAWAIIFAHIKEA